MEAILFLLWASASERNAIRLDVILFVLGDSDLPAVRHSYVVRNLSGSIRWTPAYAGVTKAN